MASEHRIAPLSELFLLLPDHRRIILGESRQIGVPNEATGLRKAAVWLSTGVVINVIAVFFLQAKSLQPASNTIVGLIPAVLMLVFLFFVTQRFRCKARLEQEGFLIPGEVVEAKWDKAITGQSTQNVVRLRYAFVTPHNRRIVKEEAQVRNDLDFNQLPVPKTPLAIVYASDGCFRVL
jgi:hypothetical protein